MKPQMKEEKTRRRIKSIIAAVFSLFFNLNLTSSEKKNSSSRERTSSASSTSETSPTPSSTPSPPTSSPTPSSFAA